MDEEQLDLLGNPTEGGATQALQQNLQQGVAEGVQQPIQEAITQAQDGVSQVVQQGAQAVQNAIPRTQDGAVDTGAINQVLPEGVQLPEQPQQPGYPEGALTDEDYQRALDTVGEEGEFEPNFFTETGAAVVGGALDAVDSVTGFGELVGDTLKQGVNSIMGNPTDPTQDIFHEDYNHRDIGWLDIPEHWKPENHTGLGNFTRGLVEFGLLTWATAGVGGAAGAGLKGATKGIPLVGGTLRSANAAVKGNKTLQFLSKGAKISAEGGVADLMSSSSEMGNLANLAEEWVPWLAPDIMKAVAVREGDNPWLARVKTVTAGAGMNHVGHLVGALGKGLWRSVDEVRAGKSIDEANIKGTETYYEQMDLELKLDEAHSTEEATELFIQGEGLGKADPMEEYVRRHSSQDSIDVYFDPNTDAATRDAIFQTATKIGASKNDAWNPIAYLSDADGRVPRKTPNPKVNPEQFSPPERATIRADGDGAVKNVGEGQLKLFEDGKYRGHTPIMTSPALKAYSKNKTKWKNFLNKATREITHSAFADLDNRLDWDKLKASIEELSGPMIRTIEDLKSGENVNLADAFRESMNDPNNRRWYIDNGNKIETINPAQKGANVLVLHALAGMASDIAAGAYHQGSKVSMKAQMDMVVDATKLILIENKKMGVMWGLDGKQQQWGFRIPDSVKKATETKLNLIDEQMEEYWKALDDLRKGNDWKTMAALMELNMLSDGSVRTISDIHEYLRSVRQGGKMDGIVIRGKFYESIKGVYYNSILSSPRTIRKAGLGTNMIAMLRPWSAYFGAIAGDYLPWAKKLSKEERWMAAVQIDSMSRAWRESLMMAKRNWDLGVARRNMDYSQKFDIEGDLAHWKSMKKYHRQFGDQWENTAYDWIDNIVDMNTSPLMKYSANAMGAGDALARTIIGRQFMAKKAAQDAAKNFDFANSTLDDFKNLVANSEENFRREIFAKNEDGVWIVKDKAASMAGDEAAMTKGLESNWKGFELISGIKGMEHFFPFVRTGVNFLDLTFQHTYLNTYRDKWKDLVVRPGRRGQGVDNAVLQKYGLKPEDVAGEIALMQGRMAMGTSFTGVATIAALGGFITGDLPISDKDRKHWRTNKIQPHSIRVPTGDGYTYVSYKELELFKPFLATMANITAYSGQLGGSTTQEMLLQMGFAASALLVEQSMLSGMGDLAQILDVSQFSATEIQNVIARMVRSQIPYSSLSADFHKAFDGTQREANTILEKIVQRDVLFRRTNPVKYDIFAKGNKAKEIYYGTENPLMRLFNTMLGWGVTYVEGDIVKETLHDIGYNLPEITDVIGDVNLNSAQKSKLSELLSESDLQKDLEWLIKSKPFQRELAAFKKNGYQESDGWRKEKASFFRAIDKIIKKHKKVAIHRMMHEYPELAKQIKLIKAKDALLKSGHGRSGGDLNRLLNYATNP